MECTSLREERDKLLEELRRLSSPSPPSSTVGMDQEEDNTFGNNSLLQQSFSALQVNREMKTDNCIVGVHYTCT